MISKGISLSLLATSLLSAVLFSSCVEDDYTANTLNPDLAVVKVTLGREMGKSSAIMIDANHVTLDESGLISDLVPDVEHSILYYTTDEEVQFTGVMVEGGEVLVWLPEVTGSYDDIDYTTVSCDFEQLFSCSQSLTVTRDSYTEVLLNPLARSGTVKLSLTINNGVLADVVSYEALITGFLSNMNLTTGEAFASDNEVFLMPEFTLSGNVLSAEIDIVEVDSAVDQTLYLCFEMSDGVVQHTKIDLTDQLTTFNDNRGTVLNLSGSFSLPTTSSFEGVVVDWERVTGDDLTIE